MQDKWRKKRCFWVDESSPVYVKYHDEEWGVPVYDDKKLYEMFLLETFQAGLSWITILRKREFFREPLMALMWKRWHATVRRK